MFGTAPAEREGRAPGVAAAILGLKATLSDGSCRRVLLYDAGGGAVVLERTGSGGWAGPDGAARLAGDDLAARIEAGLGDRWQTVECRLDGQTVVYDVRGGAVRVRRLAVARGSAPAEAAAAAADAGALMDALGIPRSKRRGKFRQAGQFGRIVLDALGGGEGAPVRLLDLACGRSYLGLFLVDQLRLLGRRVRLHGVDSEPELVEKSRRIAEGLGWQGCTFEVGDLAGWSSPAGSWDVVLGLHACDTLSDDVLAIAWRCRAPLLFVAPCCQHELRHQWEDHPLAWMSRYGLLEQRLADAVTDGLRCLVMEAVGYRVKVLRFTEADVSPKNLLIQAQWTGRPLAWCAEAAREFARTFRARPKIIRLLEEAAEPPDRPRQGACERREPPGQRISQ